VEDINLINKILMKTLIIAFGLFTFLSCNSQVQKTNTEKSINNKNMKTILVDVRTIEEWNKGHPTCAVNYPLDMVVSKAEELKQYDKVILVCRSGARAGNAKLQLESLGVKNIENLGAWQNAKCED
jgi:phage shock protein E